jgi:predicted deacylase
MTKALLAFLCATSMMIPLAAQAGEVRNREVRQENRIYQGVRNDSLTTHEYDRLQSQEARLNDLRVRDLHSGGGLSHREDVQLNRDENHLSHQIYRTKHDGPNH